MQAVLRKDVTTNSSYNVNVEKKTENYSGMALVLTEEHCLPGEQGLGALWGNGVERSPASVECDTTSIPHGTAQALTGHSPALHSWATRFRTSTAAGHCCINSSQNRLSSKSCAMTRHALNVKRSTTFQRHQCSFFKISTVKYFNQLCHFYILFFHSRLAW